MSTDNRTNEPTPEQVEAAVHAAWVKSREFRGVGGQSEFAPPWEFQQIIRAALVAAQSAAPQVIVCDYCGDALPSVQSRAHIPTTPSIQRLGFSADKVVCPECVQRARGAAPQVGRRPKRLLNQLNRIADALEEYEFDGVAADAPAWMRKAAEYIESERQWRAPVLPSSGVDEDKLAEKLRHWIFQYNQERITLKTFARAVVEAFGKEKNE